MISDKSYSMKQAARQLQNIVNFVEQGQSVGLARDEEPVVYWSQQETKRYLRKN
ncbi:MAG: hypothetical protein Q3M30_20080 [Candidatus Electrothrix sp. Rat3]|nr:hypothetical protein [Candidatus Electrothrix rattekaaiensis]